MDTGKDYQRHLTSRKDLETTCEAVRAGFAALALEKKRRATPFVDEARLLKAAASRAKNPTDLMQMAEIQAGLLAAAGVSERAAGHLQDSDRREAILGLTRNFLEPAGVNFVEKLVCRFLVTRRRALSNRMRHIGGFMAHCKLTRYIIANLKLAGKAYRWLPSWGSAWIMMPEDDTDIERYVRGLSWEVAGSPRTLIYNLTVPFLGNNVDLCLFNAGPEAVTKTTHDSAAAYLALGELKGGIDPAGADEHWKTARTALERIRTAFAEHHHSPKTFFIGAAIEAKMASGIWAWLKRGRLDNAANLTEDNQIASVTRWLCWL